MGLGPEAVTLELGPEAVNRPVECSASIHRALHLVPRTPHTGYGSPTNPSTQEATGSGIHRYPQPVEKLRPAWDA